MNKDGGVGKPYYAHPNVHWLYENKNKSRYVIHGRRNLCRLQLKHWNTVCIHVVNLKR